MPGLKSEEELRSLQARGIEVDGETCLRGVFVLPEKDEERGNAAAGDVLPWRILGNFPSPPPKT